jgi:hypothetical protein
MNNKAIKQKYESGNKNHAKENKDNISSNREKQDRIHGGK